MYRTYAARNSWWMGYRRMLVMLEIMLGYQHYFFKQLKIQRFMEQKIMG